MKNPEVHVHAPDPLDVEPVHYVHARAAEGVDSVEIRLRFDKHVGPATALRLLARAALEVLVTSRAVERPSPPAAEPDLYDEVGGIASSTRWRTA